MPAGNFLYSNWMALECLDLLVNKLSIAAMMNTDYNKEFEQKFAVGDSIQVKKPQRWTTRDGLGYSAQPINRIPTTINLDQVVGLDFEWDSFERAVKMERSKEELSKQYLEPAMAQIAQEWDSRAAKFAYQNANNVVGVLGTDPTSFDAISGAARQRLVELGCPQTGEKCMVVPPNVMRALKNASLTYFNPVADLSRQWRTGIVGSGDGFEWYESMSLYSHTAGTWAGAVTVTNNVADASSTITLTCTTGDTFNQGDVFGIANVNQVNPMTRRKTTTVVKQFVNLTAQTGAASSVTLSISPTIYGPGNQYQNVDALPAAGATVTLFPGTTSPNAKAGVNAIGFHRDAFAFANIELETPKAAEVSWVKTEPETGISVRFVRMFDPVRSVMVNRFDSAGGFGRLYSDECCVRSLGA